MSENHGRREEDSQSGKINILWRASVPIAGLTMISTAIVQIIAGSFSVYSNQVKNTAILEKITAITKRVEDLSVKQQAYDPRLLALEIQFKGLENRVIFLEGSRKEIKK